MSTKHIEFERRDYSASTETLLEKLADKVIDKVITALDGKVVLEPLMSGPDVKRYLQISEGTLQYFRDQRHIDYVKVGNKCLYPSAGIQEFLRSNYFVSHKDNMKLRAFERQAKAATQPKKGGKAK